MHKFFKALVLISPIIVASTENVKAMEQEKKECTSQCNTAVVNEMMGCTHDLVANDKLKANDPVLGGLRPIDIYNNCKKKSNDKETACKRKCEALGGWHKY